MFFVKVWPRSARVLMFLLLKHPHGVASMQDFRYVSIPKMSSRLIPAEEEKVYQARPFRALPVAF